jgi:hypothetical protein
MGDFQEELDESARNTAEEAAKLKQRGEVGAVVGLTTMFMQWNVDRFDTILAEYGSRAPAAARQVVPMFDF